MAKGITKSQQSRDNTIGKGQTNQRITMITDVI